MNTTTNIGTLWSTIPYSKIRNVYTIRTNSDDCIASTAFDNGILFVFTNDIKSLERNFVRFINNNVLIIVTTLDDNSVTIIRVINSFLDSWEIKRNMNRTP